MTFDILKHYGISFDRLQHRYEKFGQQVLSVSGVLPYLAMNEFLANNPERIEKAGVRGSGVARFIESVEAFSDEILDGTIPRWPLPEDPLASWAQSYVEFKQETGFKALYSPAGDICSELFVYHDALDYAGCLDLVGYAPNTAYNLKGPGLIEVKATAVLPKTIGPQSAAYFEAFNRNAKLYDMPKLKWRASLHLTAKGYKFEPLTNPLDFPRFCSRLTDIRWARELGYKSEWVKLEQETKATALSPEEVFA